ncbi:mitochondrial 39-S ribosomal protein L47 (MRP-L47)-domain-containing protein [Crucibulum laeve]|uniref:Large ribosomal subunit protein uL29m n=1 Tax=Crucibulum laeve TaxID=68775 RepID=A0A5C3M8M3_9AGAR|nr:mitochondrial 39-S ribosomal protein L47 (MRP-L47)-domain-containing protein [Crucibulum laeve]
MFSLINRAPKRVQRSLVRSFAEIVATAPSADSSSIPPPTIAGPNSESAEAAPRTFKYKKGARRIPTKQDHGLYAFFRRKEQKEGEDLVGDARFEVVEAPETNQIISGRAWTAAELRLKSFDDLHTLWYVVLRERNLLATQKEEARRMGVVNTQLQVSSDKVHECRKTMARIKAIMNERRLAYEGAIKLVELEQEDVEDRELLKRLRADVSVAQQEAQKAKSANAKNARELEVEADIALAKEAITSAKERVKEARVAAATEQDPAKAKQADKERRRAEVDLQAAKSVQRAAARQKAAELARKRQLALVEKVKAKDAQLVAKKEKEVAAAAAKDAQSAEEAAMAAKKAEMKKEEEVRKAAAAVELLKEQRAKEKLARLPVGAAAAGLFGR